MGKSNKLFYGLFFASVILGYLFRMTWGWQSEWMTPVSLITFLMFGSLMATQSNGWRWRTMAVAFIGCFLGALQGQWYWECHWHLTFGGFGFNPICTQAFQPRWDWKQPVIWLLACFLPRWIQRGLPDPRDVAVPQDKSPSREDGTWFRNAGIIGLGLTGAQIGVFCINGWITVPYMPSFGTILAYLFSAFIPLFTLLLIVSWQMMKWYAKGWDDSKREQWRPPTPLPPPGRHPWIVRSPPQA